jgi:dUTP pyrophosphatase
MGIMTFRYVNHASHGFPLDINPMNAAFDIRSDESVTLAPNEQRAIETRIKLLCDSGEAYIIKERSGLALNACIEVHAGVIDPDYVRYVKVILKNAGTEPFYINIGDRIAQCLRIYVCVDEMHCVTDTIDNNRAGFGSSGIK